MSFGRARNHGCRISDDWSIKGMRTLILENELLRVTVLVDKGSDIIEFRYKPLDLDFLYFAPGGIHNPDYEKPSAYTASPYLDYFNGGWNEIVPNGGPRTVYKGAELGQHGETSLARWDYVILEDGPEKVSARLWVRPLRTPFFLEKVLSLEPGRPVLQISEKLTNEAGEEMSFMWGQHIAFGRPFLEEGATIHAPARKFIVHGEMPGFQPRRFEPGSVMDWPQARAQGGGIADASQVPPYGSCQAQEMAYLTDLAAGWYAITNNARNVGFGISFSPEVFRYIWYWQQMGDIASGYPWWKRTHTAALEPWSSFPTDGLEECIKNGTACVLQPGQSLEAHLSAVAFTNLTSVEAVLPDGQVVGS